VPALGFVRTLDPGDVALERRVEEGKKPFAGMELPGRVLGVVGLGRVGSLVADAALGLGMQVLGYDPEITVDAAWSLPSRVRRATSIGELLKASHFVTLHVPLGEVTRHLVSAKTVEEMRPGAILLNFSRDGVVEDEAVLKALRGQRLKAYVTDFPTPALLGQPGVIALPHLGASTREAEDNCAVMVVDQLRDYLEHGNTKNAVNFPDASMARESPYRVAIANANVPNMLARISQVLGGRSMNIHNMLNKSKGEMAYTLVDADSPVPDDALGELLRIEGVRSVRYLPA
jgi:D-3-phosphoglycerate dehydrogenase / 2-oxoglutarate reductase